MRRNNNYAKKKKLTKLFVTFAAIAAISYGASVYFNGRQRTGDLVVAKINNEKIYKSQIDSKIKEVFAGSDSDIELPSIETFPPEVVETFAKEIYLERELVSRAKKEGITKKEDLKYQIENSKNRIIANAYLNSIIKEKVSEEKIRDKYAELNSGIAGKKEFSVAHILVKTKVEAEKIYDSLTSKKAKKAANFADLAKKNSIDKDTANKGGKLGYVLEDNMLKEIAAVVATLKKGEISKPIETKSGWHIVKLEDIKEAKAASFEEVKESLREQMIKEETGAVYKNIFDNVKIEILLKKAEENAVEKKQDEIKSEEIKDEKATEVEQKSSEQSEEVETDSTNKAE